MLPCLPEKQVILFNKLIQKILTVDLLENLITFNPIFFIFLQIGSGWTASPSAAPPSVDALADVVAAQVTENATGVPFAAGSHSDERRERRCWTPLRHEQRNGNEHHHNEGK